MLAQKRDSSLQKKSYENLKRTINNFSIFRWNFFIIRRIVFVVLWHTCIEKNLKLKKICHLVFYGNHAIDGFLNRKANWTNNLESIFLTSQIVTEMINFGFTVRPIYVAFYIFDLQEK